MSLNRWAARVDNNQAEVVNALRAAGCHVYVMGKPVDLLVSRAGRFFVIEVKRPDKARRKSSYTKEQIEFIRDARAQVHVVSGPLDALHAVGLA